MVGEDALIMNAGRRSTDVSCYLYIGSIDQAVRRATGQECRIVETSCTAKGDTHHCRFEVRESVP